MQRQRGQGSITNSQPSLHLKTNLSMPPFPASDVPCKGSPSSAVKLSRVESWLHSQDVTHTQPLLGSTLLIDMHAAATHSYHVPVPQIVMEHHPLR